MTTPPWPLALASSALAISALIHWRHDQRLRSRIARLRPDPTAAAPAPPRPGARLAARARRLRRQLGRGRHSSEQTDALPDALALIVRCLKAGIPVAEALAEVGRQGPPALAPLFQAADQQIRLGQPPEQALGDLVRPLGIPALDYLVVALSVQRETGGNLAQTLSLLEQRLRLRQQQRAKAHALTAEARASALIIGALPIGMAVLMALMVPDYMAPLVETGAGRLLLGLALLSLVTGGWVMRRLARLDG